MEEKKINKNKFNTILKILIIIFIVLIILELTTGVTSLCFRNFKHAIFRMVGIETKEGNCIGNINNFGYLAEDSKYLYYMAPSKDRRYVGISKVSKKNPTESRNKINRRGMGNY